jgi:ATP-dependent RNA helicase DDX10/DBP4
VTRYDRMFERRNRDVLSEHYAKMIDTEGNEGARGGNSALVDADEDDDFLAVRRRFDAGDAALGGSDASSSEGEADENPPIGGSQEGTRTTNGRAQYRNPEKPSNTTKTIQLSNHADEMLLIDSKRREKLLKSKKKLLKFKGHGSHMHFDDDDVPHEAEYYQREEEFAKKGRPEEQREAFVQAEKERTEAADREDKETARRKRQEKKEKRKARERDMGNAEGGEERVAMLVPYEGDGLEDEGEEGVMGKAKKRQKKWFEDASSGGEEGQARGQKRKRRNMRGEDATEPQTLEDLETMAQGLLGN